MQGACEGPTPAFAADPFIAGRRPGQCVLTVGARLFRWVSLPTNQPDLWLDNLIIRAPGSDDITQLVTLIGEEPGSGLALWLTGVSFLANGVAQGFGVSNGAVFAQGALDVLPSSPPQWRRSVGACGHGLQALVGHARLVPGQRRRLCARCALA